MTHLRIQEIDNGDARDDGALGKISINRETILIARSLRGIRMRVRVPTEAYRGIALCRQQTKQHASYSLRLVHRDPDLSVTLQEAQDAHAILSLWEEWADFLTLPKIEAAQHALPECHAPDVCARRRGATLAKRRSRARLRRKIGIAASRVYRDERLIISYE